MTPVRVIRGIKVTPSQSWTVIEVHLEGRFRYLSHTPSGTSESLQIRLRAESPQDIPSELAEDQVLVWRARDLVPLIDIHVDLDARGDPGLFLNFERPVEFKVAQPSSLERIQISLREQEGARTSRSDRIMTEGRKAMTAGDFPRAALLFTKVLGKPDDPRAPEAKELLGLAYQRAGRLAHARAEYEEYLATYRESEGVARGASAPAGAPNCKDPRTAPGRETSARDGELRTLSARRTAPANVASPGTRRSPARN